MVERRRAAGAAAALGPGDELGDVALVGGPGVRAAPDERRRERVATPQRQRRLLGDVVADMRRRPFAFGPPPIGHATRRTRVTPTTCA